MSVVPLEIAVDPAEVRRYLGYRRGRAPRPRVERRLAELWDEAVALVRPRGAYRLVEGDDAEAVAIPRPTPRLAVAVCTIGHRLEDESRRRGETGALLDALILDAYGSAAAEAAADALNQRICAEARGAGRHPAARISPGYGRWRLEAQKALLGLLPAADVGVELTATLMLVPHKSVSFAVRFEEKPQRAESRRQRCRRCGLVNCSYRCEPKVGQAPPAESLGQAEPALRLEHEGRQAEPALRLGSEGRQAEPALRLGSEGRQAEPALRLGSEGRPRLPDEDVPVH